MWLTPSSLLLQETLIKSENRSRSSWRKLRKKSKITSLKVFDFLIEVVEEVAERVEEAELEELENELEKAVEEMGPIEERVTEIDIKQITNVKNI